MGGKLMSGAHRLAAFGDLLERYRQIYIYFWRRRKRDDGGFFTEQEAAFLPAALSLQEMPVSSTAKLTARVLMALVFGLLAWSVIGKVDIVVNAPGKIIPSGRTKTIASVDIASVRALHVVEGQAVRRGDILIELDASATDAERDKATGDEGAALLQAARAQALIEAIDSGAAPRWPALQQLQRADAGLGEQQWRAEAQHLGGLYRDYQAKLQRLDGDIARYAEALPLVTERARDYQALLANHDVSAHAWLEKEQARVEMAGQLSDAKNQRAALIAETRSTAYDQLTEARKAAAAARQDALRSGAHSKLLTLRSPVDGTVQQLTVHTVGGVVPAAQPLMQIVPASRGVEVEAALENKDVGFVAEGQKAEVKIDTFEYTRYGTIPATVTHVSHDAVPDEKKGLQYTVTVALDQAQIKVDGKPMQLSPGMAVNVDVKTGERRIIEYVLSPLLQQQRESLHER
jgi:hemolysin D